MQVIGILLEYEIEYPHLSISPVDSGSFYKVIILTDNNIGGKGLISAGSNYFSPVH